MQPSLLTFQIPEERHPKLHTISGAEMLTREWPPRENLLSPWLPRRGLTMLYGPRGLGKTHFALGIAAAVAGGGQFLRWSSPNPASVLYVDGEMPGGMLADWFAQALNGANGAIDAAARITFLTSDAQERGLPDLATVSAQRAIEEQDAGREGVGEIGAARIEDAGGVAGDGLPLFIHRGKAPEGNAEGKAQMICGGGGIEVFCVLGGRGAFGAING